MEAAVAEDDATGRDKEEQRRRRDENKRGGEEGGREQQGGGENGARETVTALTPSDRHAASLRLNRPVKSTN